jgi:hypothetical protein
MSHYVHNPPDALHQWTGTSVSMLLIAACGNVQMVASLLMFNQRSVPAPLDEQKITS